MKRDLLGSQRGEVVTGVMVAIMVVMMLLGGMHMMHGDRDDRHGGDHDKMEHKHDHQKEEKHHQHQDDETDQDREGEQK